jgi:hypothetical protein
VEEEGTVDLSCVPASWLRGASLGVMLGGEGGSWEAATIECVSGRRLGCVVCVGVIVLVAGQKSSCRSLVRSRPAAVPSRGISVQADAQRQCRCLRAWSEVGPARCDHSRACNMDESAGSGGFVEAR